MKKTNPNYGIKSFISYDTISQKSYLWFTENPTLDVIDRLRKDGWIYDGYKNKWRCSIVGMNSFSYTQKYQKRICYNYGIQPIN